MGKLERYVQSLVRKFMQEERQQDLVSPAQLRLRARMTYEDLIEKMASRGFKLSIRQLQRYEAGKAGRDRRVQRRVRAISDILGCDAGEYLRGITRERAY